MKIKHKPNKHVKEKYGSIHLVQLDEENDHEHRSLIPAYFHERDKNLDIQVLVKRKKMCFYPSIH
jgi:hypothetical protein